MKQRLLIWLFLILLVFGSYKIYNIVTTPKTEIIIEYNIETNPELIGLREISIPKIKTQFNISSPDVILTTKEQDLQEYKKYNNYLISPIVLFVGNNALETDSGFSLTNVSSDKSYRKAEKNLQNILLAIEENKTWEDIGIKNNVISGKVKLAIPDKNNEIHKEIIKLFAINLVDELTTENIDEVLNRVDKIIEKCEHVENIETYILNKHSKDSPEIALIAPEYYALNKNTKKYFFSNYTDDKKNTFFIPVYLTKTISANYDLFLKTTIQSKLQENILTSYASKKMLTTIGLRPTTTNINYININRYIKTDVNIVETDSIVSEKIYSHKMPSERQEKIEVVEEVSEEKTENNTPSFWVILLIVIGCSIVLILLIWLLTSAFYL